MTDDPTGVEGYSVRAAHILLKTEAEAKNVLNQINQGASFEEYGNAYPRPVVKGHSFDVENIAFQWFVCHIRQIYDEIQ